MALADAMKRLRDWMRDDDLDLRNPLSVLGPRRLMFERLLAGGEPEALGPEALGPEALGPDGSAMWQYLIASSARTAHGRRWDLVGPPTYFELPHDATLEYVAAALADFGWRLLGTTGSDYVFRRPSPSGSGADRPGRTTEQT